MVDGEAVDGNYFAVLGVEPALGRLIAAEPAPVAVISWAYWKSRFGFDRDVLGKPLRFGTTVATIIGVAPKEFSGMLGWRRTEIWLSGGRGGAVIGRLKPGVTREEAQAQAAVLYGRAQERGRDPLAGRVHLDLEPAHAGIAIPVLRDRFAKPLMATMSIVALFPLLTCANAAGMLLARGAARDREFALRVSLGAHPDHRFGAEDPWTPRDLRYRHSAGFRCLAVHQRGGCDNRCAVRTGSSSAGYRRKAGRFVAVSGKIGRDQGRPPLRVQPGGGAVGIVAAAGQRRGPVCPAPCIPSRSRWILASQSVTAHFESRWKRTQRAATLDPVP